MNENQTSRHMLIFTIGPVQSFIETARKTEDLWMGSYILSYLVATAMEQIRDDSVEIVYPAIGNESPFEFWQQHFATPSFPNLFLAISEGITQDVLVQGSASAEECVHTEFESMAKRVLDKAFNNSWRNSYVEELFNRQISEFFDVYWVLTKEQEDQNYGDWFADTARCLASIKNCRRFKQVNEFGRKCSLDGIREILHREKADSIHDAMKWWKSFSNTYPRHCRQKEALSAVSLTKRMGMHFLEKHSKFSKEFSKNPPRFPSTSEVATAHFKEKIIQCPAVLGIYTDLCKKVRALRQSAAEESKIPNVDPLPKIKCPLPNNVDGEWLYEETYNDPYLERYYHINVSKANTQIKKCKNLREKLVRELEGEPGKYYAAIALDADLMGEVNKKAENKEQHQTNSKKLIEYSKEARCIVEENYLGKLTYSGGDDLLALANLNDLLSILSELWKKFPEDLTTISAGVCIAHNKMPLTNVIRHARNMESAAKNEGDRDALGIALYKHSGNVSQVVTNWEYGNLDVLNISQELVQLLDNDVVSKRFIYSFRDVITQLLDDEGNIMSELPSTLVNEEFKRLIDNAYKDIGKELDEIHLQTLDKTIKLWANIVPFTQFLSFLDIITFITRESK